MKLGTLLAAGKSVVLGRNGESPFHTDKRCYLPKFESGKSPVGPGEKKTGEPAKPPTGHEPAQRQGADAFSPDLARKSEREGCLAAQSSATGVRLLSPLRSHSDGRGEGQGEVRAPSSDVPARRKPAWVAKLNPFSSASKSAATAKDGKVPTQTELSLDTVKVLRNDLTDVDVEVVPLKSRPAVAAAADVAPARKPWEYLGERLFKMETT